MMTLKKRQQMKRKFDRIGTLSESESELQGEAYLWFFCRTGNQLKNRTRTTWWNKELKQTEVYCQQRTLFS